MSGARRWILCEGCGGAAWHQARNLCSRCYYRYREDGNIDDRYPRNTMPTTATIEDYEFLVRYEGLTRGQAAERMGITKKALEKAIARHRLQQQEAS